MTTSSMKNVKNIKKTFLPLVQKICTNSGNRHHSNNNHYGNKMAQTIFVMMLAFLMIACSPKNSQSKKKQNGHHFLVISIDALHPNAVGENTSPFIYSLIKKGYGFLDGRSIDPPMTLFNHTAMFTGLTPELSGQVSNGWGPGQPRNQHPTFFTKAKEKGFTTGYFYSKGNLGYLVNDQIDVHRLAGLKTIAAADEFIQNKQKSFTFLHTSGLDFIGKRHGWLSPAYMEHFKQIDAKLRNLIEKIMTQQKFVIIITSDHAGHGRIHATNHPEDYKVPFVFYSNYKKIKPMTSFLTTDIKAIVENLLDD